MTASRMSALAAFAILLWRQLGDTFYKGNAIGRLVVYSTLHCPLLEQVTTICLLEPAELNYDWQVEVGPWHLRCSGDAA